MKSKTSPHTQIITLSDIQVDSDTLTAQWGLNAYWGWFPSLEEFHECLLDILLTEFKAAIECFPSSSGKAFGYHINLSQIPQNGCFCFIPDEAGGVHVFCLSALQIRRSS